MQQGAAPPKPRPSWPHAGQPLTSDPGGIRVTDPGQIWARIPIWIWPPAPPRFLLGQQALCCLDLDPGLDPGLGVGSEGTE